MSPTLWEACCYASVLGCEDNDQTTRAPSSSYPHRVQCLRHPAALDLDNADRWLCRSRLLRLSRVEEERRCTRSLAKLRYRISKRPPREAVFSILGPSMMHSCALRGHTTRKGCRSPQAGGINWPIRLSNSGSGRRVLHAMSLAGCAPFFPTGRACLPHDGVYGDAGGKPPRSSPSRCARPARILPESSISAQRILVQLAWGRACPSTALEVPPASTVQRPEVGARVEYSMSFKTAAIMATGVDGRSGICRRSKRCDDCLDRLVQ